jgi:hypothetical protein
MVQNYKKGHVEWIECPECEKQQGAFVEHTMPFYTRIHECIKCKYLIMESEWNNINKLKQKQNGKD